MAAELTVGDFSRITHLSVKTLRHYHEVGLLEPATVNPGTGYRYYSAAQVPTAQVIRRLRDLEMPVSQVKAVLDAPDAPARNALIAAHLGRLEAELAQTRAAVESLRNLLQPPQDAPVIEHRSVPAVRGGRASRPVVSQPRRPPVVAGRPGRACRPLVRAQGLPAAGPSGGMYASAAVPAGPRRGDRLSLPVAGQRAPHRAGHAGRGPRGRTGHRLPSRVTVRRRPQLRQTWVPTPPGHEIGVDGPLREYYLRGAADTPDEAEWRTEIGWPIFRADASSGSAGPAGTGG